MELSRRDLVRQLLLLAALDQVLKYHPAKAQDGEADRMAALSLDENRLARIFTADAEREDELDPLSRLYRGEAVDPKALAELFTDALDRKSLASARESLSALGRIRRDLLSARSRISFDVFERLKRDQIEWLQPDLRALTGDRPFNHFGGLHVEFPLLMSRNGSYPYDSEQNYARALDLYTAFSGVLDNAVLRFRQGIADGIVESRLTVRSMIGQIDGMLSQQPAQSPFYSPVLNFPAAIPSDRHGHLREAFAAAIRDHIYPAYRRLRAFLAEEYLSAAREDPGLWAMKDGQALYRKLIEHETTLALEPDAIHQLGIGEVDRIKQEMERVKGQLGFEGELHAFFENVRTDPRFHPHSREQLTKGFEDIGRKVAEQVPRFFSTVPKTRLRIAPYPAFREKYEPGGSYYQGSPDGKREGIFFFNAYDLPSRFLSGMTTLYLHEGIPGHHFQISLAQEDATLPDFQRFDGNDAFVEGWALYAESLGYEMGLYEDPLQRWGNLDDEMLRAMRLVVDTGLHAKRWSREQAIDFMLANSGMSQGDAASEVDRYIADPAQALSYKIGALTIQRLRRKAESELGGKFDIRAFHMQVLGSGALPLTILEKKINGWIAAQR